MIPNRVGIFVLITSFAFHAKASELPKAEQGILDARSWNFSEKKIPLTGSWMYYEHQLLEPANIDFTHAIFTTFPALWNDFRDSKSGVGFATYAVTILVSSDIGPLSLDIPQIYSSYKLWVNGKIIAQNGSVGKSVINSIPQWLPQTIKIDQAKDTLKLVIQISNFHHHNGGSKDPIYLGADTQLHQFRHWMVIGNWTESAALTLVALIFKFLYFNKGHKKVILYFSLLCLTWAIRTLFSNQYVFIALVPEFNWELMVKIEYLTLYLTMIWTVLFLGRLFINESSKVMKYLLVGGNTFFVLFTLFTPALSYTRWLPAYIALSFLLIAYSLLTVILALVNDRAGVLLVVIAVILGLMIFGYDLLSFEGFFIYNAVGLSVGYIIIFFLLSIALLSHLKIFKRNESSELNYDDLYNQQNK